MPRKEQPVPPPLDLEVKESSSEHTEEKKSDSLIKKTYSSADREALPVREERAFGVEDQVLLMQNEYGRLCDWPKRQQDKVGHAFVVRRPDGSAIAYQANAPIASEEQIPLLDSTLERPQPIRPLVDIEELNMYGQRRYRAKTPGGTEMFARRIQEVEMNGQRGDLALMSPPPIGDKGIFWGSEKPVKLFREAQEEDSDETKARLADLKALYENPSEKTVRLEIHNPSVPIQSSRERSVQQNTVMKRYAKATGEEIFMKRSEIAKMPFWHPDPPKAGKKPLNPPPEGSANNAAAKFYFIHQADMTEEAKSLFERIINAPWGFGLKTNLRMEWCHLGAFSNHPVDEDPQYAENLIAGGKWANTQMMRQERAIKWIASNQAKTASCATETTAKQLINSHVGQEIDFMIDIKNKGVHLKLSQNIQLQAKWPMYTKPSDIAQVALFCFASTNGLLSEPQEVKSLPKEDGTQAEVASRRLKSGLPWKKGDLEQVVYGHIPKSQPKAAPEASSKQSIPPKSSPMNLEALSRLVLGEKKQPSPSETQIASETDSIAPSSKEMENVAEAQKQSAFPRIFRRKTKKIHQRRQRILTDSESESDEEISNPPANPRKKPKVLKQRKVAIPLDSDMESASESEEKNASPLLWRHRSKSHAKNQQPGLTVIDSDSEEEMEVQKKSRLRPS